MGLILRFFYTPSPQLDRVYRLKRGPCSRDEFAPDSFLQERV